MQDFAQHTGTTDQSDKVRPTRVLKFTDTLADINGVCRFIQNTARTALKNDQDLTVFTSTRLELPEIENVRNFTPIFAMKMPKYETLDLALPPLLEMLRAADEIRPDVIHISTPGAVGLVGMLAAKLMRVPVVGVYHTDFPSYVDELFDDHVSTVICKNFMSIFYRQFRSVFSRSDDYAGRLADLGIKEERIVRLRPGFDNEQFSMSLRDESIWDAHGIDRHSVKVLFCGRVSTEKNLPIITERWETIKSQIEASGRTASLVIVGDGPYRKTMEKRLKGLNAHFLGFKHGQELATIYASCDLFAFPSTTDTLGQVVMEAQASGLPVVATDEGGPKEVIEHDRTGLVMSIEDPDAWCKALADLACDESRRNAMGQAGVEHMKSFSFDASFSHYWDIHEQARAGESGANAAANPSVDPAHANNQDAEDQQAAQTLDRRRAMPDIA